MAEIALQKAGIIKNGVPVVVSSSIAMEAKDVIAKEAKAKNAPIVFSEEVRVLSSSLEGTLLECGNERYTLPLIGSYQPSNSAVAVAVLKVLGITDIADGMADAKWKCRFERVKPRVIIDGAHNFQGISAFCQSTEKFVPMENRVLLIGMLNDKDFENSAKLIANLNSRIVVTDVPSYRQTSGENVYECIKQFCPDAIYEPDNAKALNLAEKLTGESGYLCIAGSLYLAGEMRKLINAHK